MAEVTSTNRCWERAVELAGDGASIDVICRAAEILAAAEPDCYAGEGDPDE